MRIYRKSTKPTTGGVTTRYYYDQGWRVLAEADEDDDLLREYVYGNYLDEVLMVRDVTASEDYYYAHDHLYSPVALLDDAGTVLERYEYDAYGRRHVFDGDFEPQSASSYNLPIAFTGQRIDTLDGGDLEVMYYKNRYYDGETGRFLSRDPLGVVPNGFIENEEFMPELQFNDGMNLYEYAGCQPIAIIDTFGLRWTTDGVKPMGSWVTHTWREKGACAVGLTSHTIKKKGRTVWDVKHTWDEKKKKCRETCKWGKYNQVRYTGKVTGKCVRCGWFKRNICCDYTMKPLTKVEINIYKEGTDDRYIKLPKHACH